MPENNEDRDFGRGRDRGDFAFRDREQERSREGGRERGRGENPRGGGGKHTRGYSPATAAGAAADDWDRGSEFDQFEGYNSEYYNGPFYGGGYYGGGFPGGEEGREGERGERFRPGRGPISIPRGRFTGRGPKGYRRPDERIYEEICERLMAHGELDAGDIEVTVTRGDVTLSGTVDSRRSKRLAEDLCEDVLGVDDIHNRLRVRREEEASRELFRKGSGGWGR